MLSLSANVTYSKLGYKEIVHKEETFISSTNQIIEAPF